MCPENLCPPARFAYNYSPQLLIMSKIFIANAHVQPLPNKDINVHITNILWFFPYHNPSIKQINQHF